MKVFVICEFNSDLQEIFRESLELVRKNVHQVLWHYLKSFKSYGEFILGDSFFGTKFVFVYLSSSIILSISIYSYISMSLYLYIYLNLFIIISNECAII